MTVSFKDWLPILLPRGSRQHGYIGMITAYFDDSGTHNTEGAVILAGLVGRPNQWAYLDEEWAKILADPCPGKDPLSKFHMAKCQASDPKSEFRGWKRTETDYLVRRLSNVILGSGVYGYAMGLSQSAWDKAVTGKVRQVWGDAEHYCVARCITMSQRIAYNVARDDNQIAYVFDRRIGRAHLYNGIFDLIKDVDEWQKLNLLNPRLPELVSLTLAKSECFSALQAADLIAWECYQNLTDVLNGAPDRPARKEFQRITDNGRIAMQIGTKETLANGFDENYDEAWYDHAIANVLPRFGLGGQFS